MANSLSGIINQLERQKTAIERALLALREVEVPATISQVEAAGTLEVPARKGKKRSVAVRKRMKEAQRLRWAKIRGESEPSAPVPEPPKPKRRISAEGMKRIIAATKKRWRLQRAAAKSAPARKVAPVR